MTKITEASGLPESIYVKDESGEVARVFIDGYICSQMEIAGLKVGCSIEATGLASYDDTYAIENDSHARLRVRNRAEIICKESTNPTEPEKPEVKPNPGVIVIPGSGRPSSNPFADVAKGTWYYDYVMTAAQKRSGRGRSVRQLPSAGGSDPCGAGHAAVPPGRFSRSVRQALLHGYHARMVSGRHRLG